MRLATVFDSESNEARPVFELPGGRRVELRELFRPEDDLDDELHEMPIFFTDLARTVEFLDDVTDAVRQWARERAERIETREESRDEQARVDRMPFLPPVPVVRNFREFEAFEAHARFWRDKLGFRMPANGREAPSFSFSSAGSLLGHESAVHAPADCDELDYGLQLGLIVGRGGSNIRAADAWRHIAGLTIVNAFCARDIERSELANSIGRSKSRDFATAVGPYLVSLGALRDRIDADDRIHLPMRALVNGHEAARVDAATMAFTWPQMIEHASRDAELFPGDLLTSGTAASILDRNDAAWLKPGDVVELEIERLGALRTPIQPRAARDGAMLVGAGSGDVEPQMNTDEHG